MAIDSNVVGAGALNNEPPLPPAGCCCGPPNENRLVVVVVVVVVVVAAGFARLFMENSPPVLDGDMSNRGGFGLLGDVDICNEAFTGCGACGVLVTVWVLSASNENLGAIGAAAGADETLVAVVSGPNEKSGAFCAAGAGAGCGAVVTFVVVMDEIVFDLDI